MSGAALNGGGPDPRLAAVRVLSVCVIAIAVAVLAGWYFHIDRLLRVGHDYAAMVPVTAVCFLLSGTAIGIGSRPGWRRVAALLLALAIGAIALLGSLPYFADLPDSVAWIYTPTVGHRDGMALGTAVSFLLMCVSIIGIVSPWRVSAGLSQVAATLGLLISLIASIGYLLGTAALYEMFVFTAMALHTAVCFVILFSAALLARPNETWLGRLFGPGRGGRTVRRLLPAVLGAPLLLAVLVIEAARYGILNFEMRLSLMVVAVLVVAVSALVRSAYLEDEAERLEAREEDRLTSILEGLDAAVFAIDLAGEVRFANSRAEALSNGAGSPAEWLATADFVDQERVAPLPDDERPLALIADGRPLKDATIGYRTPAGEDHVLRLSAGPPSEVAGIETRILSITDVTDEQRIRDRLNRAERLDALGQLSGGIAHDMANVLGVIRLSADVGVRSRDPERMRRQFEGIQAACLRGADLTSRILAFARRQPDHLGVVDLVPFARQLFRLGRRTIPSSIELVLDLAVHDGEALAKAEPSQLENAIVNLLLNARNAIAEGGGKPRIVLGVAAPADGKVRIFVRDEGPGMTADVMRRATDPFFTTRPEAGGTGLGLAMVESFVEQSGGALLIESSPGQGTEVTLVLPRAKELPAALEEPGAIPDDLTGVNVMLVEDDPGYKSALVLALTARGADVYAYRTAQEATAALQAGIACDLLLTDVILRGGSNGFAVANVARELRPTLPIIYLSGYADTAAQAEHHTPGIFLRKPIGGDDLVREIIHAIGACD